MATTKHNWSKLPKKFKFKRYQKGKIKGIEYGHKRQVPLYGDYAIKVLKSGRVTSKQLDAARSSITRKRLFNKQYDQLWVRALFDTPVSKKAQGIRMGKGKGPVDDWILRLKSGAVLVELKSTRMPLARALKIHRLIIDALGVPGTLMIRNRYLNHNKIRFS